MIINKNKYKTKRSYSPMDPGSLNMPCLPWGKLPFHHKQNSLGKQIWGTKDAKSMNFSTSSLVSMGP